MENVTKHFIQKIIDEHNSSGKFDNKVHTRFPPEPNGYLHIGHAKAICLNFNIAEEYNGKCNLRFDDTNPIAEEDEYVRSIQEDVSWLGFDWQDRLCFASDYFQQMYEYATQLIEKGSAFVCDLASEEIKNTRGTLNDPGSESPYRNRSVDENLDLFKRMRSGEFENGTKTLRAKIDMGHPNMNMRDPVIYRILHAHHHRTKDEWCIYPMYDWAHGLEDSIEGVTHSLCSLEFEDHRPLYDWYLDELGVYHPQQIEFARLNLSYTVMSKRKLKILVENNHVEGWDDPRMPTISGFRRRGYTPEAIRNFMEEVGVAKRDNVMDVAKLESSLRSDLNQRSLRRMAVLNPLKVVITNYPEDKEELVTAKNNPEDETAGTRELPFSRELYIEKDDFMEDPPNKFFRLSPGSEVRFKFAYYIRCDEVMKDADGNIMELHCSYDKDTKGGRSKDGRKVKGTIHWVSAKHCISAEVRLYDRLFTSISPDSDTDYIDSINPNSLEVLTKCLVEPDLGHLETAIPVQFERIGYFFKDNHSDKDSLIFNRTVALRDTWSKR
ncbi:MAG: glutamine--tRNA ligase/YqeY domain fusion protein [Candidatus Neomarinimicrobiota bacterium]|nr:glutamine--tRNA ligase/YqeY domain fusion protein [Candidatus Neomarinimicrobiota bacterium]